MAERLLSSCVYNDMSSADVVAPRPAPPGSPPQAAPAAHPPHRTQRFSQRCSTTSVKIFAFGMSATPTAASAAHLQHTSRQLMSSELS